jgi:hypothetical protein
MRLFRRPPLPLVGAFIGALLPAFRMGDSSYSMETQMAFVAAGMAYGALMGWLAERFIRSRADPPV